MTRPMAEQTPMTDDEIAEALAAHKLSDWQRDVAITALKGGRMYVRIEQVITAAWRTTP